MTKSLEFRQKDKVQVIRIQTKAMLMIIHKVNKLKVNNQTSYP